MSFQQDIISARYAIHFSTIVRRVLKTKSNYNLFRKNIFYKNIEAEICEIFAIFKTKNPRLRF